MSCLEGHTTDANESNTEPCGENAAAHDDAQDSPCGESEALFCDWLKGTLGEKEQRITRVANYATYSYGPWVKEFTVQERQAKINAALKALIARGDLCLSAEGVLSARIPHVRVLTAAEKRSTSHYRHFLEWVRERLADGDRDIASISDRALDSYGAWKKYGGEHRLHKIKKFFALFVENGDLVLDPTQTKFLKVERGSGAGSPGSRPAKQPGKSAPDDCESSVSKDSRPVSFYAHFLSWIEAYLAKTGDSEIASIVDRAADSYEPVFKSGERRFRVDKLRLSLAFLIDDRKLCLDETATKIAMGAPCPRKDEAGTEPHFLAWLKVRLAVWNYEESIVSFLNRAATDYIFWVDTSDTHGSLRKIVPAVSEFIRNGDLFLDKTGMRFSRRPVGCEQPIPAEFALDIDTFVSGSDLNFLFWVRWRIHTRAIYTTGYLVDDAMVNYQPWKKCGAGDRVIRIMSSLASYIKDGQLGYNRGKLELK